MSKNRRFFVPDSNLKIGSCIVFDEGESNHIRNTLRLSKGDTVVVFNGQEEYLTELVSLRSGEVKANVIEFIEEVQKEKSTEITIFLGLLKPSAFELALEKLTEIGIDRIVPLETKYSVIKSDTVQKKRQRWEKIILAACKQSERITVPKLSNSMFFENLEEEVTKYEQVIIFSSQRADLPEKITLKDSAKKLAFIIGPEGGFSPGEHEYADKQKFEFFSLGENVLRAETAAIVGLSRIMYELS